MCERDAAESPAQSPEKFTARERLVMGRICLHEIQFTNMNSLLFKISRQVLAMPCLAA